MIPPKDLFEQLLAITPGGEKVQIPNKRSEMIEMREKLSTLKIGKPSDYEYIDMLLEAEAEGRAEFEPESN